MTLTPDDLSDLQDLLTSRGWELVLQNAKREWGPEGWAEKLERTFANANIDPATAQQQYGQAKVAHREIWRVLNWAEEQVNAAKAAKAHQVYETSMSRRGAGL